MKIGTIYSKLENTCLFLLGLGVTIAYIPGITGAAIPSGWLWLFITLPILLLFYKAKLQLEHIFGFIFLIIALVSLSWSIRFNIGVFYYFQLLTYAIAFYIGSSLLDLRPIFRGLALGVGINSITGIFQFLGWHDIYTNHREVAGLFVNKNIFCETSVIIFIALLVLNLWKWIPTTLPAIVLAPSRAGLLALVVCGYIYLFSKSKILAYVLICFAIGIFLAPNNQFSMSSVDQRFDLWLDTIRGLTFFGNGVGSYETLFPKNAILINTISERPKYVHNDLLQLLFEYGIFSLILIPFFWNILKLKCKENFILYAILILSMVTYPFHTPIISFIWFIVAGCVVNNNANYGSFGIYRRLELSPGT